MTPLVRTRIDQALAAALLQGFRPRRDPDHVFVLFVDCTNETEFSWGLRHPDIPGAAAALGQNEAALRARLAGFAGVPVLGAVYDAGGELVGSEIVELIASPPAAASPARLPPHEAVGVLCADEDACLQARGKVPSDDDGGTR